MVGPVPGTECPMPTGTGRRAPFTNSGIGGQIWVETPTEPWRECSWPRLPWPHSAALIHLCLTQVALVVFTVHTLVTEENAMDAEKAFVTLTVLNILNKAQAFLPFSIHSVVQVRRGVGRPAPRSLSSLHPPTVSPGRGGGQSG